MNHTLARLFKNRNPKVSSEDIVEVFLKSEFEKQLPAIRLDFAYMALETAAQSYGKLKNEVVQMTQKLTRKGKAGRRQGASKTPSKHRPWYVRFRKGNGHDYEDYFEWCMKNQVPEEEMYTRDSFKKVKLK